MRSGRVRSTAEDVLDRSVEVVIVLAAAGALAFLVACRCLNLKEKLSIGVSVAALSVSACAARYAARSEPRVGMIGGTYSKGVWIGENLPLVFFNHGSKGTLLRIISVRGDQPGLSLRPASFDTVADR